jgi:hypothetical protein
LRNAIAAFDRSKIASVAKPTTEAVHAQRRPAPPHCRWAVSLPNEQEFDFALRWEPSDGRWKGLSVWARYGEVFSKGSARDEQPEFRFVVDDTVPLLPR